MKLQEIKSAMQKLNRNDLNEIRRFATQLSSSTSDLRVGIAAKFTNSKTGAVLEGTIIKVNRKTVQLSTKQDKWGKNISFPQTWVLPISLVELS